MKALLCHCRNYRSQVKRLANTPAGIKPEELGEKVLEAKDAIVALLTIEAEDDIQRIIPLLGGEIRKMCRDTGHRVVVILPFGHLSNKLADTNITLKAFSLLEKELEEYHPKRAHFGSDKKLLLDIFGHKGNVRYREF